MFPRLLKWTVGKRKNKNNKKRSIIGVFLLHLWVMYYLLAGIGGVGHKKKNVPFVC